MNVTHYPTYTMPGTTSTQQTSTPMYVDLLCDDISYHSTTTSTSMSTTTPTATAIYSSSSPTLVDLPSNTTTRPDKVVMIPSSGVIIEQSYNRNQNSTATNTTNMNTAPTQSSSYTYNNHYSNDQDGTMDLYHQQQEEPQQRYFKGRPVKAKNAHLPDEVLAFKQQRKIRTVAATCTGGVVGLVALGPIGGVLGATSAYAAAKTVGKHRERKLTEHAMLQKLYQSSSIREAIASDDPTQITSSTDIVPSSSSSYGNGASSSYTGRSISQIQIPIERAEAA